MAYTKYSLTPASNTAAPPDGAPEGMLPSAVNDTMRDMMSQIRDCGDGIRGGTYTMTAPVITGGSVTGVTFSSSAATITGGSVSGITDLAVADGGTGASTAANARTNLGAAASGANSDITSLTGLTTPLSVAQGGTGSATAAPAFHAYVSGTDQSFSSNTFTKIRLNAELFDTNSNFDSTTNYRFTPTIAGYYQCTISSYIQGTVISRMLISIYKNGSESIRAGDINTAGNIVAGTGLIYMNGSTDYLEGFIYITATSPSIGLGAQYSYFQGYLARGA